VGSGWRRPRPWPRLPRRSTLLIIVFAALAAAGLAWTPPPVMVTAPGAVTVVDGDTFRIGRETIRLEGIDAPELRQACADGWPAGEVAREALADLLWAGRPKCERVKTDRYGRTVAVCRVNDEDIAAAMARRGLAWSYMTYSVRYLPEEVLARYDGVGVHAHVCASPADWRALHPH
jgi:endonuclease YncB( thermonuclease family)